MLQRGRKSASLLAVPAVDGSPPKLQPPQTLQDDERILFDQIVAACDARHFVQSDLPLLVSYVQATLMAHDAARDPGKLTAWEKATRLQMSLWPPACGSRRKAAPIPRRSAAGCRQLCRIRGRIFPMPQKMPDGERTICWIEKLCLYPTGPERGQHVCLSLAQKEMIRRIYDDPDGISVPITGPLAAYLALYHICGPAALQRVRALSATSTFSRCGTRPAPSCARCSSATAMLLCARNWGRDTQHDLGVDR